MASQAFVTPARLRSLDKKLHHIVKHQASTISAEQAVMVDSLLQNREYLGQEMVRIIIVNPERVVEGLVSLIGDSMLTD